MTEADSEGACPQFAPDAQNGQHAIAQASAGHCRSVATRPGSCFSAEGFLTEEHRDPGDTRFDTSIIGCKGRLPVPEAGLTLRFGLPTNALLQRAARKSESRELPCGAP